MKCPLCNNEFQGSPDKEWKFRTYNVQKFKCGKCGKGFNVYSAPGKKTWTIPKTKR